MKIVKQFFTVIYWNIFFTWCIVTGNKKAAEEFIWKDIYKERELKEKKNSST